MMCYKLVKHRIFCACVQEEDTLLAMLEDPFLVSSSNTFKTIPERKFSVSEESSSERAKWVYVFQREYATVDPAFVDVSTSPSLFNFIRKFCIASNAKFSPFLL